MYSCEAPTLFLSSWGTKDLEVTSGNEAVMCAEML